jgi:hypothetical protein
VDDQLAAVRGFACPKTSEICSDGSDGARPATLAI